MPVSESHSSDRRAVVIILDGVGVGACADAGAYGDEGTNSLVNTARHVGGLRLPVLGRLGLGNIDRIEGVPGQEYPSASWGRMAERSPGKDSTSGHWELMGCPLSEPFPTYPGGFPAEVIESFERETGCTVLGNTPASGTEIIEELGPEHIRTGRPIVYTSADSVFQIASHEDVLSVDGLYELCRIARRILVPPHHVARVIARPFTGEPGGFVRTAGRRDFSLPPPEDTLLDELSRCGLRVVTVGKIHDLFACRGIDEIIQAAGNDEAMRLAAEAVRHAAPASGNAEAMRLSAETVQRAAPFSFLFINLIDFDMLWGHRRDVESYAGGLERFDAWLGDFMELLPEGTLLAITSDHGCDPTHRGSDHTREYVPILAKRMGIDRGIPLGTRSSFSDLAATLAEFFDLDWRVGESFLDRLD
ncbi:MAG: phosphopentomutase [bacterium]|nr:MAG: phosphopentomutase [bacterium]